MSINYMKRCVREWRMGDGENPVVAQVITYGATAREFNEHNALEIAHEIVEMAEDLPQSYDNGTASSNKYRATQWRERPIRVFFNEALGKEKIDDNDISRRKNMDQGAEIGSGERGADREETT